MSNATATLPSLRELLAAGAHYGHRKEWSKPATREYTYTIRNGVCVINLEETQACLSEAGQFLAKAVAEGKQVLLVGTKRQAKDIVSKIGQAAGISYVSERWLGGTLTNFDVVRKNIQRLADLEQRQGNEEDQAKLTKRERYQMSEEILRLKGVFGGLSTMTRLPDIMVIVDPHEEETALREAKRMDIPTVAICDTNTDPTSVDYPIPANDDAPKALELILSYLGNVITEAKKTA